MSSPSVRLTRCVVLAWCVVLAGCSTSLTSLQPARTTPAGHVSVTTSAQITPPVGLAEETFDALRGAAQTTGHANQDELHALAVAATMALVAAPSGDAQIMLAVGLTRRLELSARVRSTSVGGGVRLQWLRTRAGIYGAVGVRVDTSFGAFPVGRAIPFELERFRRLDVAVPITLGFSRKHLHLWAGPMLMTTRYAASGHTCPDREGTRCVSSVPVDAVGRARFAAGQVGFAIGSGRFWVAAEVTVARARVRADLEVPMSGVSARTSLDVSGRLVTPSVGLILWI